MIDIEAVNELRLDRRCDRRYDLQIADILYPERVRLFLLLLNTDTAYHRHPVDAVFCLAHSGPLWQTEIIVARVSRIGEL